MTLWTERRLLGVAEVVLGRQRSPEHDTGPHMVPYLRAANVQPGRIDLEDVKSMNFTPREQRAFSLRRGDVLVTEGSGSLASVGAAAQWSGDDAETVCFQNTLLRLRARAGVDSRWLHWWAQHAFVSGLFAAVAGGANIYHLSADRVRSLAASVPPLDEQRRIAEFLDTETARLDDLVALRTSQLDALPERYVSALQDLYGPQPTPDFLEGRAESAEARPLRYLLSRTVGGRTPDATLIDDGPIPWLAIGDLLHGGEVHAGSRSFSASTLREIGMSQAPTGSVALAMYASLGKVSTLASPSAFNQAIIGLVPRPEVPAGYLVGWLELAKPSLPALARTATQPNLNAEQVRSLHFPRHDPQAMAEIASRRASLQERLGYSSSALGGAQRLVGERRQALITAAVTGQLDVATARVGAAHGG